MTIWDSHWGQISHLCHFFPRVRINSAVYAVVVDHDDDHREVIPVEEGSHRIQKQHGCPSKYYTTVVHPPAHGLHLHAREAEGAVSLHADDPLAFTTAALLQCCCSDSKTEADSHCSECTGIQPAVRDMLFVIQHVPKLIEVPERSTTWNILHCIYFIELRSQCPS